jgi:2-methylcitrate dehydratase
VCVEHPQFTIDYHDPEKRSIANAVTIEFQDGSALKETVEFPLGHRRRRNEGFPLLQAKFESNLASRFPANQQEAILRMSLDQSTLERLPVHEYVNLYVS